MADLTFNCLTGDLTGRVGQTVIKSRAVSGGRGGSTTSDGVALLKNNPFSTAIKEIKGNADSVGGTLPLGLYNLVPYPAARRNRANWVKLEPVSGIPTHNRTELAMHGRGEIGSQGCIVPLDGSINIIVAAIKGYVGRNRDYPTLEVVAIGEFGPLLKKMSDAAATA